MDYGLDLSVLPGYLTAVVLICLAPGPDMAYMAAVGIGAGRTAATRAGLGITVGVFAYVISVAAGLGTTISHHQQLLIAIQLIGAGYLVWLAGSTLRDRPQVYTAPEHLSGNPRWFLRGIMVNLTNPKAALFLLALLPQFIGSASNPTAQLLMLGIMFQLIGLGIDLAIGWTAGTFRNRVLSSPRTLTAMSWTSAAVFLTLATVVGVDAAHTLESA